ncbi:uncharacterized protein LOC144947092 isoform X2 [Lampetra fluviatilis]
MAAKVGGMERVTLPAAAVAVATVYALVSLLGRGRRHGRGGGEEVEAAGELHLESSRPAVKALAWLPCPTMVGKIKKSGANARRGKGGRAAGAADAGVVLKRFLRTYDKHCAATESTPSAPLRLVLKTHADAGTLVNKFVVAQAEGSVGPSVLLQPLLLAIRDERYMQGKELCVLDVPLSNQDVAELSLLLEMRGKTWYPFARLVLSDCALDVWSMGRLARALRTSILTHLHLDYNKIGDTGALALVQGLAGNAQMLSLSLCYCGLGPPSGAPLASLVTSTAIVEVYLDGNDLRCEGATELVRPLVEHAERVAATRPRLDVGDGEDLAKQLLDAPDKSGVRSAVSLLDEGEQPPQVPVDPSGSSIAKRKKSRRGARRKKKGPEKAEVGPWLRKLHLSDNGIDGLGAGRQTAPLDFSMLLARLIRLSDALQELDLDDNDVGELGGRQILEALKQRKEAKRLPIKMRVTARMSPDTFSAILKSSGKVKKARRGKKKKKK